MVEHMMIAECFPHKCGNSGSIVSSKKFLCIIGTSFYLFIFFLGVFARMPKLARKEKANKQTNHVAKQQSCE
jgi:hypothetical protein